MCVLLVTFRAELLLATDLFSSEYTNSMMLNNQPRGIGNTIWSRPGITYTHRHVYDISKWGWIINM